MGQEILLPAPALKEAAKDGEHLTRIARDSRVAGRFGPNSWPVSLSRPLKEWGGRFALGICAQAVSMLANFAYVMILVRMIGPRAFGEYSVAWSCLALVDSLLTALFGDTIPALMHRLPERRWPEFRAAVCVWSTVISGIVAIATLVLSVFAGHWAPEYSNLLLACGTAIPCLRLYQLFRRFSYLDGDQALALGGAAVYAFVLFAALAFIWTIGWTTAASGLACFVVANAASGSLILASRAQYAIPGRAILGWSYRHLWQSGRWLVFSSFGYWLGTIGLIPLVAWFSNVEMGGVLRILQTFTSPLYNATGAIVTVILPYAAKTLRTASARDVTHFAYKWTALFIAISVTYSAVMIAGGKPLFRLVFGDKSAVLTETVIVIVSLAAVLECIAQSMSVPLMASGHSKSVFVSRIASLTVLYGALPAALQMGVLVGIAGATAASNLAAAVTFVHYLSCYSRSKEIRAGSTNVSVAAS
jgi:O-antigen/teichoic acid export membrane protein